MFLSSKPSVALSQIALYLTGWTSKILREEFAFLKEYSAFLSPSYVVCSSGNGSSEASRKYIKNRKRFEFAFHHPLNAGCFQAKLI
ncbi:MAG: transposase [Candidatus Hermodarchaeota archaeon]